MSIGDTHTTDQDTDSVLGAILLSRGWRSIDDHRAWEWCHRGRRPDPRLFATGACVLVDHAAGGYVVEGPLQFDRPTDALRYRSRHELLDRLELIEAWTFPRTAAELDADHADSVDGGPSRT
ncbi:hypothetical protein [Microlunatus speluncae]|uniref:hypothetical protein n=1 Tax=Microlunatus speluncae TaxID=2594267 RepID=UPI0012662040|nr:hypothetical protein [Microlunatus speluncae]